MDSELVEGCIALALERHRGPSGTPAGLTLLLAGFFALVSAQAQTRIPVPNGSFELPETDFAFPQVDSWERTPQPIWWNELDNGPWEQLAGVFLNTPDGSPDHIGNIDGQQALFLFAVPQVGLFQDYESIGGTNTTPSHELGAAFQTNKCYRLTVGVIGGGGGMQEGASLGLGFYYRDASSNRISLAMTNVVYTAGMFPDRTNLIDFGVTLAAVQPGDAWAGAHIGVELLSTVGFGYTNGGYWDLDNVRLVEFASPTLTDAARGGSGFQFTLLSNPGAVVEIVASTNVSASLSNWTRLDVLTNDTGSANIIDASSGLGQRFYNARELP